MEKHRITVFCIEYNKTAGEGAAVLKSFPQPLTAAEEKYYVQKYTEGDLEAKHILIERNLRLVAHIVKKYQPPPEEMEDLLSIGTIGLMKAVVTFDPEKSAKLATYAARCIENELLMHFRGKKKSSKEVSLYEPIGTDKEGNEISLLDIIESPPVDIVEEYSTRQDIRFLFSSMKDILTPKEYQVICCRYGLFENNEMTQREIADQLHISRSYVSRIEKNALKKLKTLFG